MVVQSDDVTATPALKPAKRVGWGEDTDMGVSQPFPVTSLVDRCKKSRSPPPVKTAAPGQGPIDVELFCSPDEGDRRWTKKNVLAFDGGGIRGYSSLLILQALMEEIAKCEREEDPQARSSADSPIFFRREEVDSPEEAFIALPCHYFDYIAGTSTGGLTAIWLGRLRWSSEQCIEEFKKMVAQGIRKPNPANMGLQPRRINTLGLPLRSSSWPRDQSNDTNARGFFDSPVATRTSADRQTGAFASNPQRCKTIVLSFQMKNGAGKPFILRSYSHQRKGINPFERNPGMGEDLTISEVITRASTPPPSVRPSKARGERFVDGSSWVNNPSWEVFNEIRMMQVSSEDPDPEDPFGFFLSIGTGGVRSPKSAVFWKLLWSSDKTALKALSMQSTKVHQEIAQLTEGDTTVQYMRLSVETGLEGIGLDWKPPSTGPQTLAHIEEATKLYIRQISSKLRDCAVTLVRHRRQRALTSLWENFALGIRYRCSLKDCRTPKIRHQTRNDLVKHLIFEHKITPPDSAHYYEIERTLNDGRLYEDFDAVD